MKKSVSFVGVLQAAGGGGAFILFPFDTMEVFGKKNMIPVHLVYENKIRYTGRIANMGHGPMVPVLKKIRLELGKEFGDSISVQVTLDESVRKVEVPESIQVVLKAELLWDRFQALSYTNQKEQVRGILDAKRDATKEARLASLIKMLRNK